MQKIILLTLIVSSFSVFSQNKVVYGEDNRLDVFESTDNLLVNLSRSTAAMINSSQVKIKAYGKAEISGRSLEDRGMCKTERFAKQMTAANCSGFLVGKNLLATAGHCIKSDRDCAKYNWVFDFKVASSDQFEVNVPRSSVYSCKSIIGRSLADVDGSKDDWALIELDRNVAGRDFLEVREEGQPAVGTELAVIGHPTGLPTKIADGATVTKLDKNFFYADLDTYGGNSGSAVFNSKTGVVEGILVRGATDYVRRDGCMVTNVLAQGVKNSEGVSNISRLSKLILDHRK